jgi:hypothetical protein
VDLLDLRMTLLAGGSDVVFVDAGPGVGVGKDKVGGVAGGADGGDRQALAVEPLAVDAHGVVLENLILPDVVGPGDFRSLLMTATAEDRDVHHCGWRTGTDRAEDLMLPMTIGAARRHGVASLRGLAVQAGSVLAALPWVAGVAVDGFIGQRLDLVGTVTAGAGHQATMDAPCVILGLPIVAHPAIDGRNLFVVKVLAFQVRVTEDALEVAVKRGSEYRLIDEDGSFRAAAGAGQVRVRVAGQAVVVRLRSCRRGEAERDADSQSSTE